MKAPTPVASLPAAKRRRRSSREGVRGGDDRLFFIDEADGGDEEYEWYEAEDGAEASAADGVGPFRPSEEIGAAKGAPVGSRSASSRAKVLLPSIATAVPAKLFAVGRSLTGSARNLSVGITRFVTSRAILSGTVGAAVLSLLVIQTILSKRGSGSKLFGNGQRQGANGNKGRGGKKQKDNKKKKYGDYSKGYPEEDEAADPDEKKTESGRPSPHRRALAGLRAAAGSTLAKLGAGSAGAPPFARGEGGLDAGGAEGRGGRAVDPDGPPEQDRAAGAGDAASEAVGSRSAEGAAAAETGRLRRQLAALARAHGSLEQEYEASLRMLHDARLELRRFKSKSNGNNEGEGERQQMIMEQAIDKLEQQYKQKMREESDRIQSETEERVRSKLTDEYRKEFLSSPSFRQLVDQASSAKIEEAVSTAIQETIAQQQILQKQEMAKVKEAIQKVLQRERRAMKEQVARNTERVREWVERQQEGLARREEEGGGAVDDYVVDRRAERSAQGRGYANEYREDKYSGSSFRDGRRMDAARSGRNDVAEEEMRGDLNLYPEQSDYTVDATNAEKYQDDGTAGEVEEEMPPPGAPSRQRHSSSSPRNVYREAAKRKQQQRRREQGV